MVAAKSVDLPMFPLGNVLFPGQLLPLHIFEPRYQQMLQRCLTTSKEFGVVLIERGHEVGGGDMRCNVGTVATIIDAAEAEPGHWAIITAGTRRILVNRWHRDDPWPHADVSDLEDPRERATEIAELWESAQQRFRWVADLAAGLGDRSYSAIPQLSEDPAIGSFQLAALSPLGSFDRQKVLETSGVATRLGVLGGMLDDVADMLQAEIALRDSPGE